MAYEKQNQIFKFNLSNTIVELNQQSLSAYLSNSMAQDLFEVNISIFNFQQNDDKMHFLVCWKFFPTGDSRPRVYHPHHHLSLL